MKILIVYYSRGGNTRTVAQALAQAVGGDIEPIVDMEKRSGFTGFVRSGYEALFSKLTRIGEMRYDPAAYDLVVVGSPVWAGRPSTPSISFLKKYQAQIQRLALFVTHADAENQYEQVLRAMEHAAGKKSVGWLSLPSAQIRNLNNSKIIRFANELNRL